jgi:hypothetical protein
MLDVRRTAYVAVVWACWSSETQVKRGHRTVGADTELIEKLGGKDLCPCESGRRFPPMLPRRWPI